MLIAGAGYVGTALATRLTARGHEVFALRRHPGSTPGLHAISADLTDPASLRALPEVDRVVIAAAPDASTESGYRATYVEGSRNLLAVLATRGHVPARVVFTSSTAVYAQVGGELVDESAPTEPTHFTGVQLLEAERVWRESRLECVILRLAGIYGPGRARLIERVARGEASYCPDQPRWVNRNHREDCAAALEHLLFLDAPAPVYIGSDCEPAEQRSVLEWLARALSLPPPPRGRGMSPERPGAGNKRCSSRLLRESGFRFRYPSYREGYAELVRDYLSQPRPAP